ncbi:unnamed protein product [Trichogramma brassicae]|uniref:Uncharacterized protein n=1 Tax=Trichogramma brassicae TaxID=86971 RepID=A0A6H5IZK2_9HYME|nr:unnamed protein product [Trichogramma brassicae]
MRMQKMCLTSNWWMEKPYLASNLKNPSNLLEKIIGKGESVPNAKDRDTRRCIEEMKISIVEKQRLLNSVIVEHSNTSPSVGPFQDHRLISDSDSDDERYLRFRAERPDAERLPSERLRSIVVVPPGSGLIRHEELACQRHPTRPELCVPPVRAPRAESPGLRQPIPRKPRGRSLSPYLRENPPVPPHLHRSIKIRLDAPVTARIRPRVRTPPRSPILPAKRHFGLAFISKSSPPCHSALSRLGPPVTTQPPLKVLTPPTSPAKPTTASTRRKERNHRRTLARRKPIKMIVTSYTASYVSFSIRRQRIESPNHNSYACAGTVPYHSLPYYIIIIYLTIITIGFTLLPIILKLIIST